MLAAFSAAFAQLTDPRMQRLVVRCILVTIVVYAVLLGVVFWLLQDTTVSGLLWLDRLFDLGAGVTALVIAWLMFPGIVSSVLALFLDDVVEIVESRHYPGLAPPRPLALSEQVGASARLVALTVVLNLILLPLYVVLFFLPPANLLLFYAVNGKLVGREYFETVALRRMDRAVVTDVRKRESATIWGAGVIATALLSVPFVNLVAPVVGMAAMVHLFHKLTANRLN